MFRTFAQEVLERREDLHCQICFERFDGSVHQPLHHCPQAEHIICSHCYEKILKEAREERHAALCPFCPANVRSPVDIRVSTSTLHNLEKLLGRLPFPSPKFTTVMDRREVYRQRIMRDLCCRDCELQITDIDFAFTCLKCNPWLHRSYDQLEQFIHDLRQKGVCCAQCRSPHARHAHALVEAREVEAWVKPFAAVIYDSDFANSGERYTRLNEIVSKPIYCYQANDLLLFAQLISQGIMRLPIEMQTSQIVVSFLMEIPANLHKLTLVDGLLQMSYEQLPMACRREIFLWAREMFHMIRKYVSNPEAKKHIEQAYIDILRRHPILQEIFRDEKIRLTHELEFARMGMFTETDPQSMLALLDLSPLCLSHEQRKTVQQMTLNLINGVPLNEYKRWIDKLEEYRRKCSDWDRQMAWVFENTSN